MTTPPAPQDLDIGRLLVVDDEADFARGLCRLLASEFPRCECVHVIRSEDALAELATRGADLMITDLRMPGMDGLALLGHALELEPDLVAVVLTAHGDIGTAVEAVKLGAYDFLSKPVESEDLFRVVHRGLERSRLARENARLRELLAGGAPTLIGESPAIQRLRAQVAAVARSDYPVLVRGESGCGKELVARLIHALSPRAGRPFLAVNCPAIPETLLESELFGHEKGAFTGADRSRRGLFVEASTGTIHLDEIGDISPGVQTKLLRVLQEGEVRPLGSSRSVRVEARVVASTNQDLEAKIAHRTFREDLYYRLNVLTVPVPPLRERVEDIPLLAQYFLRQACVEMRCSEKSATPEVLEWLRRRDWPGNVRELQNTMRRLTVFCPGELVDLRALRLAEPGQGALQAPTQAAQPLAYKEAKARVVDQFTLAYVRDLLQSTGGNISEAARLSGLSRVALQKINARLGIDASNFKG
ncbi:MAG: sigma-54 dependent transcriptional regulator [Desulfovibrio sp.]|nr:sigma-54 dependent transcriptional regulator [Desulfovibrio sp.]